jgi:hypothetical protein
MNCDERRRRNQATLANVKTIEDLLQGAETVSSVVYDIRRHAARKARVSFESASLAYEAHVRQHCCEPSSLVGT